MQSREDERRPEDAVRQETKEAIASMREHAQDLRDWYHRRDRNAFWRLIQVGRQDGERAAEKEGAIRLEVLRIVLPREYDGDRVAHFCRRCGGLGVRRDRRSDLVRDFGAPAAWPSGTSAASERGVGRHSLLPEKF